MRPVRGYRKVTSTQDVAEILRTLLSMQSPIDQDKEHTWVLCLDALNVVKSVHLVAVGIRNESFLHPREIFRHALVEGAVKIIVGHNHPSGVPEPSDEDLKSTARLCAAGVILGIEVMDHVIITNNRFDSAMREK